MDINTARLDTIEGSKWYLAILSQIAFIKTCIWTILAQVFPFVFNISIFINSTSGEIIKSINWTKNIRSPWREFNNNLITAADFIV